MSDSSVMDFPHTISIMQARNWRERAELEIAPRQTRTEEITSGTVGGNFSVVSPNNALDNA